MAEQNHPQFKNKSLYRGLLVYVICVIAFPPAKSGIDLIRIPSFTLLLLILIQVIFPQFRFSKTANLIAVIVIIAFGFASNLLNL